MSPQVSILFILNLALLFGNLVASLNPTFQACEPQSCGNSQNITYPFHIKGKQDPSCGLPHFGLVCASNGFPMLNLSNIFYIVHEIFYHNHSLRISNPNLQISNSTNCLSPSNNLTASLRFTLAPNQKKVLLAFDCELPSLPEMKENVVGCFKGNRTRSVLGMAVDDEEKKLKYAEDNCRGGAMTTVVENVEGGIRVALGRGFLLRSRNWTRNWTASECDACQSSGGRCGFDLDASSFRCLCRDSDQFPRCSSGEGKSVVIAATVSVAAIVGAFVLIIYWFRRTLFRDKITTFWKNKSKAHQDFEAFLKSHGSLATKRYSYWDIKKMTNCFKEKLGQGGYGSVFKGKLHDKCPVAVKVLKETKGNGEEFMNEVVSISKTSHVNVVTLLGFCFEGSKKALVYELMTNGSLEKFIFENEVNLLSCENLHQIAVGVARGLEYLHRGCNTRILHLDIKPHNILLDENFCPKISDFGLAKICLRDESVVSMTGARGTIGYIAPEVIYRHFGAVSLKSDVYSFGMMVLEMVGVQRNVNVNIDDTSEIYFPHWIYKRLELDKDLALRSIRNEGDRKRIRQMVITSLWCIQTNPLKRPMMSKVVEMLEGSIETLQIPPKPYLSSPSASPCPSSSSSY